MRSFDPLPRLPAEQVPEKAEAYVPHESTLLRAYFGKEPFIQCVYHTHECGCKIVGNGTLPHPLKIEFCEAHRQMTWAKSGAGR